MIVIPYWHLVALGAVIVALVIWPGRRGVLWAVSCMLLVLLLTGCASAPEPKPEPLAPVVVCEVPRGMAEVEAEPDRPLGEYSQRDVAAFVAELHRWGSRGWARVEAIRERNADCVRRNGL